MRDISGLELATNQAISEKGWREAVNRNTALCADNMALGRELTRLRAAIEEALGYLGGDYPDTAAQEVLRMALDPSSVSKPDQEGGQS